MKGPRWANAVFLIGVVCIFGVFVGTAYHDGCDLPQTLGFLGLSLPLILVLVVALGLIINAAVLCIDLMRGRRNLFKLSHHEKRILLACSLAIAIDGGGAAFMIWHPIGWGWSIVLGFAVYVLGVFFQLRLFKGISENDMLAFQDRVFKFREHPNPLWFVP